MGDGRRLRRGDAAGQHPATVDVRLGPPLASTLLDLPRPPATFLADSPVPLSEEQRARFAAYRALLLEWNRRINLTAIREPEEVERRLFLDGLRMVPAIEDELGGEGPRLVDVGSGAGFPGLVMAIARPGWRVTLIEATGKKVRFLEAVIAALGLASATAIQGRAEELGRDPAHRGRYDGATARAVASLPALLELCMPFVRVGGRGFFPKGAALGPELAEGERAAALVGARIVKAEPLTGGGSGDPVTRLVIAAKIAETPRSYPRRAGIPAREPLGRAKP